MKKYFILLFACLFVLPVMAQKNRKKGIKKPMVKAAQKLDTRYLTELGTYLQGEETFLSANKLTSPQMRKMLVATFRDKSDDDDFNKALEQYFPAKYDADLPAIFMPYFSGNVTLQQLQELVKADKADNLRRAAEGLRRCSDSLYRDSMVEVTLVKVAEQTGKKVKKKNMKKFVSDSPEDYLSALKDFIRVSRGSFVGNGIKNAAVVGENAESMTEDWVNAIYHTISLDDLKAYTAYLSSDAAKKATAAKQSIKDAIFDIQTDCVVHFQKWTYTAYPSLFTKKQTADKKGRGKKKGSKAVQPADADITIDGGIYH